MRTFFGFVLGVALTCGAAFYHDSNLAPGEPAGPLAARPIVNWDVLGAVLRDTEAGIRHFWDPGGN